MGHQETVLNCSILRRNKMKKIILLFSLCIVSILTLPVAASDRPATTTGKLASEESKQLNPLKLLTNPQSYIGSCGGCASNPDRTDGQRLCHLRQALWLREQHLDCLRRRRVQQPPDGAPAGTVARVAGDLLASPRVTTLASGSRRFCLAGTQYVVK